MITDFFRKFIRNFIIEESEGATLIEYALVASLISIVAIGGFKIAGNFCQNTFLNITGNVENADGPRQ